MEELKFMYLINCEREGECYWEIGLTENPDPLNESKIFIECYRKELIGLSAAKHIINAIEINLSNLLNECKHDGYIIESPSKGISYDIPLNVIEEIFDFWFNLYKDNDNFRKVLSLMELRKKIDFSNPSISNSLKGFTAKWVSRIERLHSYRPSSKKIKFKKEPMWLDS